MTKEEQLEGYASTCLLAPLARLNPREDLNAGTGPGTGHQPCRLGEPTPVHDYQLGWEKQRLDGATEMANSAAG